MSSRVDMVYILGSYSPQHEKTLHHQAVSVCVYLLFRQDVWSWTKRQDSRAELIAQVLIEVLFVMSAQVQYCQAQSTQRSTTSTWQWPMQCCEIGQICFLAAHGLNLIFIKASERKVTWTVCYPVIGGGITVSKIVFPEPQGPISRHWSPFPLALSPTPFEAARLYIRDWCITWCACLLPRTDQLTPQERHTGFELVHPVGAN